MSTQTGRLEILLAEDCQPDVVLVRTALTEQQLDFSLHVIEDGAQALAYLESIDADPGRPPLDLVLLDMHLPKHDGPEILAKLRSTQSCGQTPVILLSGSDSPRDRRSAREYSGVHYFRKPSHLDEFMRLGRLVRDILGNDTRRAEA